MVQQVEAFRAGLNAQITGRAADMLTPGFMEFAKVSLAGGFKITETDIRGILRRLLEFFATGSGGPYTIKSRNFTFGSPAAAGGNIGTGVINRLNVDQYAYNIEAQTPDAKTAICVADENSGASKHEEIFEVRGADPARDAIVIQGSGRIARLKSLSARDSLSFIANPSFSEFSGTSGTKAAPGAGVTAITGWTPDAIGNFSIISDETYRDFEGDLTPESLYIKHNAGGTSIFQNFNLRRVQVNPDVPWFFRLAVYKPAGQTTGSITFRVGNNTFTKTVTSMATGWNIIHHHSDTPFVGDSTNWYFNFKKDAPVVQITTTAFLNSTEYLLADDIIFAPMQQFDGAWYAPVGGQTKFLRDDKFTWSDTATDAARIQRWLWRAFGVYLPSTTGSPTWLDPT